MRKRFLSLFLVLALCLALTPVQVHAATVTEITVTGITNKYRVNDLVYIALDGMMIAGNGSVPPDAEDAARILLINGTPHSPMDADWTSLTWQLNTTYVWQVTFTPGGTDDFDPANLTCTVNGESVALTNVTDNSATMSYSIKACQPASFQTEPQAKTLTYNGEMQELVTAGRTRDGVIEYKEGVGAWGTEIPKGTDAGNYLINVRIVGDANHVDYELPTPLNTLISPLDVTATITGNHAIVQYDGNPHTVSGYSIEFSSSLCSDADLSYTGLPEDQTVTATTQGDHIMGLDETDFTPVNPNFDFTINVTPGYLFIRNLPQATWTSSPAEKPGMTYDGTA